MVNIVSNGIGLYRLAMRAALLVFFWSAALISVAEETKQFDVAAPGLSLVKNSMQDALLHPIALSSVKRLSNNLRVEKQTSAPGLRQNFMYKAADLARLNNAFAFYRDLVTRQGEVVFSCAERNCGPSNDWANRLFGERNLAGRDSNQSYFAGQLDDGLHQGWVSVYSVTNGRREYYIYVSFIPAPPRDIVADTKRGLLYSQASLSDSDIKKLSIAVTKSSLRLTLVAFSKSQSLSFEENVNESLNLAQKYRIELSERLGIDAEIIGTRHMGALGQIPVGYKGDAWGYLYLHD